MLKTLLFLLLLPAVVSAQASRDMEIWRETDCYVHALRYITETKGKVNDTCYKILPDSIREFYIIRTSFLNNLPDTLNGYRIHYINPDSNLSSIVHKGKNTPVYYLAKWHHHLDYYQFWVMQASIKRKKLQYDRKAYKFHYFYHQETSKFEFTRTECVSW